MVLDYCSSRLAGMTEALFNNAVAYSTLIDTYLASYNNGAYAKLGMAQFTRDVSEFCLRFGCGYCSKLSVHVSTPIEHHCGCDV